ncbi:unnamed protein product [Mortierella alpina]
MSQDSPVLGRHIFSTVLVAKYRVAHLNLPFFQLGIRRKAVGNQQCCQRHFSKLQLETSSKSANQRKVSIFQREISISQQTPNSLPSSIARVSFAPASRSRTRPHPPCTSHSLICPPSTVLLELTAPIFFVAHLQ